MRSPRFVRSLRKWTVTSPQEIPATCFLIGTPAAIKDIVDAQIMTPAIAEPRKEVGPYAPKIISIQIDPEKIGDVVGQRGKTINEIIARTYF